MELHDEDLHVGMEDGFEGLLDVVGDGQNPSGFEVMEDEEVLGGGGCDGGGGEDREIWLNRTVVEDGQDDLLHVSDPSLFYSDFLSLPDFPCMSSSSSSSSTPAPAKPIAGSSLSSTASSSASSAASWAVLRADVEAEDAERSAHHHQDHQEHPHQQQQGLDATSSMALSSTDCQGLDDAVDCMDVMESLGSIDLLENYEIWDPSPLFDEDDDDHRKPFDQFHEQQEFLHQQLLPPSVEVDHHQPLTVRDCKRANDGREQRTIVDDGDGSCCKESGDDHEKPNSEDLAMVFFEWLKSNKESISAEDLRNIKIKKSTIECAAKRLGGGKEGMKQLLKLILQWVQNHHLQKRRMREEAVAVAAAATENNDANNFPCQTEHNPNAKSNDLNPSIICNSSNNSAPPEPNPCFSSPAAWLPPPPYMTDPAAIVPLPPTPAFPSMVGYLGADRYANCSTSHCPPLSEYHMFNTVPTWAPLAPTTPPPFSLPPPPPPPHPHAYGGYGSQYPYPFVAGAGDGMVRLGSSATKEARKKRMARQRRFFTHHHRSQNHHNGLQNQMVDDNCTGGAIQGNYGGWVYWQPAAGGSPTPVAGQMQTSAGQTQNVDRPISQGHSHQRQNGGDSKKQGWKTEKNLRFLLQKVLKQSDVGNLGRIVLPKKEAETHLPELEARDGIPIAMEDIGTSRVWNMRYRGFYFAVSNGKFLVKAIHCFSSLPCSFSKREFACMLMNIWVLDYICPSYIFEVQDVPESSKR
ncbi:B3 domain-containing transcription factor [Ancistrocladus abbreviatus]